jgi:alginate O-acetyltransferase complex protein AlgI
MLFTSWSFAALVLGCFVLYYLPGLSRWQTYFLIIASFLFYAYGQLPLLLLLLGSIAINVVTSYLVVITAAWPEESMGDSRCGA